MTDRRNPFTEISFAKYEGVHRMPFALKERAIRHETNRQRVVGSLLVELFIMTGFGILPEGLAVTLRGAISQNLEGSSKNMTQAAHCAPRQIYIGAETPQQILQKVFPERAWAFDVLFAETDILPSGFNVCDSRAERCGLNDAFRNACQFIITAGQNAPTTDPKIAVLKADNAFSIYRDHAALAYRESLERLKDRLKPRFLFPRERAKWTEQLQITEQYIETLRRAPGKAEGISRQKTEGLIKAYQANKDG